MCNRLLALPLVVFIGLSCVSNPCGPSPDHQDYRIPLNDCILVNDGTKLSSFDLATGKMIDLYVGDDNCSIYSYDYCRTSKELFMILHEPNPEDKTFITQVVRLSSGRYLDTLSQLSTCYDCDGFLTYNNISVSPSGRFLAFEGSYYEGNFFQALDLRTSELLRFERGFTEFVRILAWSSDEKSVYTKAHDYLVRYNMTSIETEMLTSPNLRDYIGEDYLLTQGYVGDRIDLRGLVGTDRIKFINWAPDGWSFVYQTWDEVDRLHSFNLRDTTNELILSHHFPNERSKQFDIVWDRNLTPGADRPDLSEDDRIVFFEESILDSFPSVNDSVTYDIGQSYSISYLRPNWQESTSFGTLNGYFFRNSISQEKFHVAELDFLFWYFALMKVPEYWFLLLHYDSYPEMTIDSLVLQFSAYNDDYYQDLLYFVNIDYAKILADNKQEYNQLVYRDYRFHEVFLSYLANSNFENLRDSVFSIFEGENTTLIETCLDTLQHSPSGERRRLITFYKLIHNNLSNYYGRTIHPDLELAKKDLLIEELMDDWFYKLFSRNKDQIMSVDYARRKVLSFSHQSR